MKIFRVIATVFFESPHWVIVVERENDGNYAVAREVFPCEPTDPEIYQFVLNHYQQLKFSNPQQIELIIKRKNPKRQLRDVKKQVDKLKQGMPKLSHAQQVLKEELEQHKKLKKSQSSKQKQQQQTEKFEQKQEKKKQKHRGH